MVGGAILSATIVRVQRCFGGRGRPVPTIYRVALTRGLPQRNFSKRYDDELFKHPAVG